jgi:hypothetical protein
MFEFVDRIWHFLFRSRIDESIEAIASRLKFFQRVLLALLAAGFGLALVTRDHIAEVASDAGFGVMAVLEPASLSLPSGTRAQMERRLDSVRPRLASKARQWISEQNHSSSGFAWGISQLVAASPSESAAFKDEYFEFLKEDIDESCGCFIYDSIPHTISLGWVLLSYSRLNERPPADLVSKLLGAQDQRGWWSVALDATPSDANGSTHATALSTLALRGLVDEGLLDGEMKTAASAAILRGQTWLSGNLRRGWDEVSDYPDNERRSRDRSLGAISAVAIDGSGMAAGFTHVRARGPGPSPNLSFSSDAFIQRRNGSVYVDRYRHIPYAWMPAGLAASYSMANVTERTDIRRLVAASTLQDISDIGVVREEWMVAEIVFAQTMFLEKMVPIVSP